MAKKLPTLPGVGPQLGLSVEKAGQGYSVTGAQSYNSAIRSLRSKPLEEEEEKWYSGSQPTGRETLARIYTTTQDDPVRGEQLFFSYQQFVQDPSTPLYNPYTKATNPAVGKIAELGVDVSGGINDEWLQRNASAMNHYRTGTSLTPLAPSGNSSAENDVGYWYYKVTEAEETTKKAEAEWAALQEELTYWAGRSDRNYSDQQILGRIDWSNYPTLTRMDEGRKQGVPLSLNRPVGYSEDAIYGTLWAARNDGGTGNGMADSVQSVLGNGNVWEEDARISALLDPTSESYCPYAAGSTVDDEALYFGVSSFDEGWLERNRAMIASNDETERKMYGKVYDAEQTTLQAEAELKQLQAQVNLALAFSNDPDAVIASIDWRDYPTLTKMDKSLKSGDIMAMTRAVPYKQGDILSGIRGRCASRDSTVLDSFAKGVTAALAGAGKVAPVKEEKKPWWERDKEDGQERKPFGFGQGWPTGEAETEDKTAEKAEASPGTEKSSSVIGKLSSVFGKPSSVTEESSSVTEEPSSVIEDSSSVIEDSSAVTEDKTTEKQPAPKAAPRVTVLPSQATDAIEQQRNRTLDAAGPDVAAAGTDAEKRVWQYARPSQMPKLVKDVSFGMETSKLTSPQAMAQYRNTVIPYAASNYHKTAKIVAEQEQAAMQLLQAKAEGKDTSGIKMPYSAEEYTQAKAQLRQMSRAFDILQQKGDTEAMEKFSTLHTVHTLMTMDFDDSPWYAYTSYDALLQQGYSPDVVAALAQADVKFYEDVQSDKLLEQIGAMYGSAHDIEALYPGFAVKWFKAKSASARNLQDAKYFLLQFNDDFQQVVRDRPFRQGDGGGPGAYDPSQAQYHGNANIDVTGHSAVQDHALEVDADKVRETSSVPDLWEMHVYDSKVFPFAYSDAAGSLPANMTEAELDTVWYLEKTKGEKAAEAYLRYLTNDDYGQLNVRRTIAEQESMAAYTREHPVVANIVSVMAAPYQAIGAVYSLGQQIKGENINPYSSAFSFNVGRDVTRSTSKQMINESLGEDTVEAFFANIAYDATVSTADSLYSRLLTGGPLSPYLMGTCAMSGAIQDAKFRGASNEEALLLGGVSFISEVGSEMVTSKVFDSAAFMSAGSTREALQNMMRRLPMAGLEEGAGEMLTETINTVADSVIMDSRSTYSLNVERYMAENPSMPRAEAERRARRDATMQILYAGATGFASGEGMHLAGSAVGYVFNGRAYASVEESRSAAAKDRMQQNQQTADADQQQAPYAQQLAPEAMPAMPAPMPLQGDAASMPADAGANVDLNADPEGDAESIDIDLDADPVAVVKPAVPVESSRAVDEDVQAEPQETAAEPPVVESNPMPAEPGLRPVLTPDARDLALDVLEQAAATDDESAMVTATAAVLTAQADNEANQTKAQSAAIAMADRYGALESTTILQEVMLADDVQITKEGLQEAVAVATAYDGKARKVLDNIAATYRVQPSDVDALMAATQEDMQAGAAEAVQQQEHDFRVAHRVKELVADGALDGMRPYQTAVRHAEENLTSAQDSLDQAQQKQAAAGANLQTVAAEHLKNPTEASMRGAVQQAAKDMEGAVIVTRQQESAVQKQEAAVQEAKAEYNAVRERTMKEIREQAVTDVAAEEQQEAERVAAEEEAAVQAAENQRQSGNIVAVEAEAFAAEMERQNPGMTEQQRDQLKERYTAWLSEKQSAQGSDISVNTAATASAAEKGVASGTRHAVELMSRISQTFGIRFKVTDGVKDGIRYRGAYESDGTILINRDATQDEVLRKTLVHELTHHAEKGKAYAAFAKELLDIVYGDNADQLKADLAATEARYRQAMGDKYKDGVAYSELVAAKAEEILGNEDVINRLTAEKPSIAARVWQTLKDFVKKISGVKSTEADRIRRAEQLYRKALEGANGQRLNGLRFALRETNSIPWAVQVKQTQDLMIPSSATLTVSDHLQIMAQIGEPDLPIGMNLSDFRKVTRAPRGSRSAHGLSTKVMLTLPEALNKPIAWFDNPARNSVYIVTSLNDDSNNPVVAIVQKNQTDNVGTPMHRLISAYGMSDVMQYMLDHLPDGSRYSIPNKKAFSSLAGSPYTMTEPDFQALEKRFTEIVPRNSAVVNHARAQASTNETKDTRFADPVPLLPSPEILDAEMAAFHERMSNPPSDPPGNSNTQQQTPNPDNLGERQFAAQTAQRSNAIPDWLKRSLWGDRFYERDSNRAQAERAFERIAGEGFDASHYRLMKQPSWNADDNVEALVLLHMALRSADQGGWGNPAAAMEIAHRFNTEGTKQGQDLQSRQLFSRMTPTGMRLWAAGHAESELLAYQEDYGPRAKRARENAKDIEDDIGQYDGSDPLAPDENGDVTITPEAVQRWGVPVNERQQALIDHYRLNNVTRPGLFYNKATLRQRMLEAILATPDPNAQTGMGMTLVQRLELMQAGAPVVTEADLSYIVDRMQEFVGASEEDQAGRLGDLALARAYEAYGNITPAARRDKARTWRYTSMLLSIPSATRNVIGNAAQGAANAVAHDVAVLLDKLVSGVTHERTMALNTMQERAAGWHAFVDETVNTYRDHFVDRATTRRGNDRYNMNQRGRMFQTSVPEALRTVEGFLMSVGDRNVWRKAFVQSMAEQQRVADLNGADFDPDAAMKRATADANYATFSESNAVSTALGALKRVPVVGDLFDFIMPFTGVPTNIVKRMGQYSPFGLAWNVGRAIGRAWTGRTFDQHAFVNGVSRGLTGTALMAAGMMLFKMGVIKLGTGEEEDKEYALHTAMGKQYTPYIQIGDEYVSLSALAPFISPITMGATTMKILEEDEDMGNAALNAAIAAGDQIFDASYMANLSDIFGGYGSQTENLLTTMGSSMISQNIPSILGQWASALDPYVRNTRDRDKLVQIVNSGLINKLPWLREELLPAKVDVAGRRVENTDQGVLAFVDPFNRTSVEEDPAMIELDRLLTVLGTSSHLPSDALSGTKTALSGVAAPVEGQDKEAYQVRYGELWRLGGSTFDASGNRVVITGVNDLIQSEAYQKMTDQQKANAISGIMSAAKTGAAYEMGEKLGHEVKETDSADEEYTMKAVRAMPERFAGMSNEYLTEAGKKARAEGKNITPLGTSMEHLTAWYNQTGDGAFIPKGISGSFSRSKVQYDLTGEELEKLWKLYEGCLEKRLSTINWDADPADVAQAVEKAYSNAAKDAKDEYVNPTEEE